ncbi:MAG: glycosyltransferase family 8 protein [Verrucomicrobiota bacterium]
MSHPLHFSFTTNKTFLQHTGIAIQSLLNSLPANNPATIWLLVRPETEPALDPLTSLFRQSSHQLKVCPLDPQRFSHLSPRGGFDLENYFRLLLPEITPPEVTRILHLDSDLLVIDNPSPLVEINLDNHFAAAVEDQRPPNLEQLHLNPHTPYFNTGVLLFNLPRFRSEEIGPKALRFALDNPDHVPAVDQDALNAILAHKFLPLSPKWNQMPFHLRKNPPPLLTANPVDIQAARQSPAIVHFAGGHKPWEYLTIHPHKQHYWKLLQNSPWKNYQPPKPTLRTRFRKLGRQLRQLS